MESLKLDRTTQKRKITSMSNRLKKGFQLDMWLHSEVETHITEFKFAYLDFINLQEEYSAALAGDEGLKEEYDVVNGLNTAEYAASVESIYNEVMSLHQKHLEAVQEEQHKKDEELSALKLVKEVVAVVKEAKRRLDSIVPRVEELLRDKGSCENELLELQVDKDSLEKVAERISKVKAKIDEDPDDDLGEDSDELDNMLAVSEEFVKKIEVEILRRRKESIETTLHEGEEPTHTAHPGLSGQSSPLTSLPQLPNLSTRGLTSTVYSAFPHMAISAGASVPSTVPIFPPSVQVSLQTGSPRIGNSVFPPASPQLPSTYPGHSVFSGASANVFPSSSTARDITSPVGLTSTASNIYTSASAIGGAPHLPQFSVFPPSPGGLPSAAMYPASIPEVKVKRTELPKFNGSRQAWPEFKVLWPKLALPTFKYDQETLAAELRKCLSGTAAEMVKSISVIGAQPFNIMWGRLSQFYDDSSATVRAALRRLKNLRPVREEDYKALTAFIDEVESCYSMLTTLDQVSCLSLMHVDDVADLLPPSVRKDWNKILFALSQEDQGRPFPFLMSFLLQERWMISKYLTESYEIRRKRDSSHNTGNQSLTKPSGQSQGSGRNGGKGKSLCCVHPQGTVKHTSEQCSAFQKLNHKGKLDSLRKVGACFRCFGRHLRTDCRANDPCVKCGDRRHHTLLCCVRKQPPAGQACGEESSAQDPPQSVTTDSHSANSKSMSLYATFSVPVDKTKHQAIVFTDDGSDSSYITNRAARWLGARKLGKYLLEITTTGGKETDYESQEYELDLMTKSGRKVTVNMFGLEKITGKLSKLDLEVLSELFPNENVAKLQRLRTDVDILLGTDHFGLHPKSEISQAGENLSLMEGPLGICLQGSHPDLKEEVHTNFVQSLRAAVPLTNKVSNHSISAVHPIINTPLPPESVTCSTVSHLTRTEESKILNFIQGEELATHIVPKCGGCKCSKCPLPGHTYSFEEEAELKLIRDGLKYDESARAWTARYPWKKDPYSLPDNRYAVLAAFYRLKKKLRRDVQLAQTYQSQMEDMVQRGVAKEVSPKELEEYKGPFFYISHLGVPNPRSKSTPFRIVFNSSQSYKGASLNDHLCKGPDAYLNNQLGILLRWRENEVALVGDIKKMYNSIILEEEEQHCHRYLWSNIDDPVPKTFVITRVNMGDRPAGAISTEALYLTAERFSDEHPAAATMLKVSSYVDDLMDSTETAEEARELTGGAENILQKGGFRIKFWLYSGDTPEDGETEVLGVRWIPHEDEIAVQSSLNFSPKKRGVHTLPDLKPEEIPGKLPEKLTKRLTLAQVMKIYDPLGILSPFTLLGKILLRKSWEEKLGWDEPLPPDLHEKWIRFFIATKDLNQLRYPRVLKPDEAVGDPMLIIFSDASAVAYGFAAYVRWQLNDNTFWCRLVLAKCKIAPLMKRSTPQMELNAAVLGKRGREAVLKEMRYQFKEFIHIVDSETVLCMLQKTSTRFKLYEGVRVGEIQASTGGDISCWAWIAGGQNISDWLTRGKDPSELSATSQWFNGPSFLQKPIDEWGLKLCEAEDKKEASSHAISSEAQESAIRYVEFSDYRRLVRVIARVLNVLNKQNVRKELSIEMLEKAEKVLIKDAQRELHEECSKIDRRGRQGGRYYRLKPVLIEGYWKIGTRLEFNPMVPENDPQYLLPSHHSLTKLLMLQAHREAIHKSRDTTLARFRQRFWTLQGSKLAASVANNCQLCKLKKPKLLLQRMGQLPEVRSKPAPPFTYVMVDYMGPFSVRGEVQKRTTGKAWTVIFADLVCRAVFLEAVFDYTSDAFMTALCKFASVRGYPRTIYSDPGSNLVCCSKELQEHWKAMLEKGEVTSRSAELGLEWKLSMANAPWQNGAVEALVKSCKKALHIAIGEQRLSPSEFSGVMYEVANMVNERPIGISSSESELSILTPNSLLLGRSTAKNPGGWYPTSGTFARYHLVQQISNTFWNQWTKCVAPGLVTDEKWHQESKELKVGDVVLVLESSAIKSEYRLAVVQEVYPGSDGVIRKARIMYKHYIVGGRSVEYKGLTEQTVLRPVQRLSVIVPVDKR